MLKRFVCCLLIAFTLCGLVSPVSVGASEMDHSSCAIPHLDIPLSYDVQHYVYELSWEYDIDPILVMAIIQKESKCDPNTVGDYGKAIGLMQIQRQWHYERIRELKCTDLYDPYQNILVGMNYLAELFEGDMTMEWVLMAYNGGRTWANKHAVAGYTTKYAREVIDIMDDFCEELEAAYVTDVVDEA